MVHDAGDIGVGESDAAEGSVAKHVARRGVSALAKEKPGCALR